jgi:hypothetical protein
VRHTLDVNNPTAERIDGSRPGVLVVLGEVVQDLMPRCLRTDEDVRHRLERWLVDERSVRNSEVLVARSPIEEREQRMAHAASGSPSTSNDSPPFVTLSFSRSISPQGKNAEPVNARQFEQWQL